MTRAPSFVEPRIWNRLNFIVYLLGILIGYNNDKLYLIRELFEYYFDCDHRSQLCYLSVAVDHLQPPCHHVHEALVLLPVLAPPPAAPHQGRVTANDGVQLIIVTLPPLPLSPGLNIPGPWRLPRRGEVAHAPPCPGLPAHVVLVDVGHRDPGGQIDDVGNHVGNGSKRSGAGHVGQEARVPGLLRPRHNGVAVLGVETRPELGLPPHTEPAQGGQDKQEAGDGDHRYIEQAGGALQTVDHSARC